MISSVNMALRDKNSITHTLIAASQ